MRLTGLFLLALCFAVVSCGDDATEPPVVAFSLELEVVDTAGAPVEGLTVAIWNLPVGGIEPLIQDTFKRRAVTTVTFTLPQRSVCDFASYDLEGELAQSLIEADTLLTGTHALRLGDGVEYSAGLEVMKYELVAHDEETGEEVFRDHKYMTIIMLDIQRFNTTKTDADGLWSSTDRTLVPGLYDLGVMMATNENGEPFQQFEMSTELRIHLYDDLGQVMKVNHVVTDGANRFEITWDPPVPPSIEELWDTEPGGERPATTQKMIPPPPPLEFRLWQNNPNPYN